MGNKNSKNNQMDTTATNHQPKNEKLKSKELGYNYRVTDNYVFFMEGFLHQWYKSPMIMSINNKTFTYNCCEQYMMIEKAILFNDYKSVDKLKKSENPLDQKLIGRQITNFNEQTWQKHRFDIVYRGNLAKFQQNKKLKDKLLSYPHTIEFVNANPSDKIWGIGVGVFNPLVTDSNNWKGLNLLGKVITKVRNTLIQSVNNEIILNNITHKALFITAGYVRRIESKYKFIVPNEIIVLLSNYFSILEDVRFNVFNSENCVAENDGMLCKTSLYPSMLKCHRLFTSDKGYNNGINIWRLKFTSKDINGREGGIGIVSNYKRDRILKARPWINDNCLKNIIYWSRIMRHIDPRGMLGQRSMNVGKQWKDGDIITILLNCNEWYVQFYLNDQLLKDIANEKFDKMKIESDRKYYPIIAFYDENDQYEVVV